MVLYVIFFKVKSTKAHFKHPVCTSPTHCLQPLQWNLDLMKCQGTRKLVCYIEVLFHTLHYYWAENIVHYTEDFVM